jgi:uncharacterized membrane protein
MTQSARKLLGTVLTLVVLVAYAGVAIAIYEAWLTASPTWASLLYFAVTGLLWAVPISYVIRWMARPDRA